MPLQTAMAFAVAAPAVLSVPTTVAAQARGNAQAEQSQWLRNRGGAAPRSQPTARSLPPVSRFMSESGEAFTLDRSGQRPLLRFERRDETWVLRATAVPRGDVIYRNDEGQQILRISPGGGVTVYTTRAPGGSPASFTGAGERLALPSLGPAQLFQLMTRRSAMLSQTMGRLIEINVDTDEEAEGLTVEALILSTDAVLRIARSPTGRSSLSQLRRIVIAQGSSASASYSRGELRIVVAPVQGVAGRPSSARVIRALLPSDHNR
ncbi:MAG: DUF4908 domain-containing protein [Brevundimonas sp.]|nr:DUF4908 domain-containing protein [Brevundimonas sp.]